MDVSISWNLIDSLYQQFIWQPNHQRLYNDHVVSAAGSDMKPTVVNQRRQVCWLLGVQSLTVHIPSPGIVVISIITIHHSCSPAAALFQAPNITSILSLLHGLSTYVSDFSRPSVFSLFLSLILWFIYF